MPRSSKRRRLRSTLAGLLVVIGLAAVAAGVVVTHAHRVLYNPRVFADRAAASLDDQRVAAFVGDHAARAIIEHDRDLTPFGPLVRAAAQTVASSEAFRAIVRAAAVRAHRAAMAEPSRRIVLSVPDLDVLVRSTIAKADPDLAAKIPRRIAARFTSQETDGKATVKILLDIWALGTRLVWVSVAGIVGGIALIVAGVLLGVHRSEILFKTGIGFVVMAALLLLGLPIGRAVLSAQAETPLGQGAVAGLWDVYTAGIKPWALLLGAIGVILASATRSLFERVELGAQARRLLDWFGKRPRAWPAQLLRGALLLALGALAVVNPSEAVAVGAMLAGAGLAFVGLGELFTLILRWLPEEKRVDEAFARGGSRRLRAGAVIVVALAFGTTILLLGQRETAPVVARDGSCNGAPELCNRPLDNVVFAGAHNAMSSEDIPNWMFPQQERGVRSQLVDGIRALLIDTHYGRPVGGHIKTDLESEHASMEKYAEAIGEEGVAAAMRIRDRLVGLAEGPPGVYLCHGFCELGATPLVDMLHTVHEFLVENPSEVVLMIVEDYVEPEDLAAAFNESGLVELVYKGAVTTPWPTLREMIDNGERLIVFAESGREGIPWIHPAFDTIQETPYTFHKPEEFSCAPNRGGEAGSLFQINHWIETAPTPLPKNAAIVNAYDVLLRRARKCQEERGHLPNILAVDFYRTGDLFRVVRVLNGVEPPAQPPP